MKKIIESLPIGWTEKQLKDNNTFLRRGKSPVYSEDNQGLFVINQDCIRWNCINLDKVKYHVVPNQIDESFYLCEGDILINSTGTGTIGRVNQWLYSDVQAVADSHVTVLRTTEDSIDSTYARYFLTSELGQRYLESVCYTGSTNQIELSKRYFSKLELPCAPLPEQKAIAAILTKVDESIEATESSIYSLERIKESLMQNLLTGKLKPNGVWRNDDGFYDDAKLGKVPKGWEVRKLKDIFEINSETLSSHTNLSYEFRYITIKSVNMEVVNYDKCPKYSFVDSPGRARRIIKSGDILISGVRPNLKSFAIYNKPNDENWICSTGLYVLRALEKEDNFYYFYQLLSSIGEKQFHSYVAGSNYPAIGDSDLKNILLYAPPYEEQVLIGDKIKFLSKGIEEKHLKIKSLDRLKKSLMQNLLTGKVRVNVDEINKLLDKA